MSNRVNISITGLYISYWSLQDPLCQTQNLAYLRELTAHGYRFALMTFEQPKYQLASTQLAAMKRELASQGIYWYPLRYHKRFSLLAKAFDSLCGIGIGVYIVLRHRPRVVHSRASIPAAMALVLSRLCGLKFLYDADSRLSEEYADTGRWARSSPAFRVTAWFEALARKAAHSIVVLTEKMRHDFVQAFGVRVPVAVIPCCVNEGRFRFDPQARVRRRRELDVGNAKLFIYVGKISPRYLVDEMFEFFKAARERVGPARFLILTADPPEAIQRVADRHGITDQDYHVRYANHQGVVEWLSASDVGLAFILSAGCERGSSPVKIGEYLAIGLPVVITDAIGDYSALIARERLGVVVGEHTLAKYRESAVRLNDLWAEGTRLRERCRAAAVAHVSLELVGTVRYRAVYQDLLCSGGALPERARQIET